MKQVAKEAANENLNVFDEMKDISKAYMTKRECSVQSHNARIMFAENISLCCIRK